MENKRNYSKPQIVYESFELSSNIAASCTVIVNSADIATCAKGQDIGGVTVFGSTANCDYVPEDMDKFCYHVPINDGSAFSS